MKEPQRSLCKCPVEISDTTPTSTDNSNSSSGLRLSERIRSQRTRKIYQGQPRRLVILGATFTTAKLYFEQVGSPLYYNVDVTNNNERHTFQFTGAQYSNFGNYLFISGLTPNTVYTVELYVTYESGDVFPVNQTKTFRTAVAEGAVKDLVLKNPQNKVFTVENGIDANQTTEFTLEFTPLRDHVDYRIHIPALEYDTTISYETMVNYDLYSIQFSGTNVLFNTSYDAFVETLYGVDDDRYIFDTSASITTVDEQYYLQPDFAVQTVFNKSLDISYQPIQIDHIPYVKNFFYVNGEKYMDISFSTDYDNIVTILNLTINHEYTLAISTFFPETQNEYIDIANKVIVTTLNESEAILVRDTTNPIIKNTSLEILYEDPSGSSFTLTPTIEPSDGTFVLNTTDKKIVFSDLHINTNYVVTVVSTYTSTTNNQYTVQDNYTTLNQGPVSNLLVTEIRGNPSNAVISFTSAPGFLFLREAEYVVQFGDNIESTLNYRSTGTTINGLTNGVYEYNVKAVYPANLNVVPVIPSYTYNSTGSIEIETIAIGDLVTDLTIFGSRIIFNKSQSGFTNHTYYYIKLEKVQDGEENKIVYLEDRNYDWEVDEPLRIFDLIPDTSYNYTIKGYYDFSNFETENSGEIRTLNEAPATITNMIVGVNSVSINVSNILTPGVPLNTRFDINGVTEQDFSSNTSFSINTLKSNSIIPFQIISRYGSGGFGVARDYYLVNEFQTLYAEPAAVNGEFLFNHPIYGNSAILSITNVNSIEVDHNILFVEYTDILNQVIDTSYNVTVDGSVQIQDVSANTSLTARVETYYKEKSPSYFTYQYEQSSYNSNPFNFIATMTKFISIVKNNSIEIRWIDLDATVDISYSVQWVESGSGSSPTEIILDYSTDHYTIVNLERNTIYDISFTRLTDPDPPNTQFTSLRTLNEGPITSLDSVIVLNTGLYGNVITLDLNGSFDSTNILENRFTLNYDGTSTDFVSNTGIIDIYLPDDATAIGTALSGSIKTVYNPTPTTLETPYVIYDTPENGYTSDILNFTVENKKDPFVFVNGNLEPPIDTPYVFSDSTGMTLTSSTVFPPYYSGTGVIFTDNSNGTLYGHKYLDRPNVNQHALLYVDNPVQEPAYLEQSISGDYLFTNYYSLAFYIAKHLADSIPYGNSELPYSGTSTSSTVEYKVQIMDSNGVIFQTNPLIADDLAWNQIQIKFYLTHSSKDVKLRIQRNYYELNHLLLSDISMVSIGAEFTPTESLQYSPSTWKTIDNATLSTDLSWNDFYNGESVLQLSTNMTVGFWLYIHPITNHYNEKVLLLVGDSNADYNRNNVLSFYIKNKRLYFENQSHVYAFKRHSIHHPYRETIPVYYQVVYTNGQVSVFENGIRLQEYIPETPLQEAKRTQNVYVGNPTEILPSSGPIVRDVCFYNFPFTEIQATRIYNSIREPYSSFGNYSDILPFEIFDINIVAPNTYTSTPIPYQYYLHNGDILPKSILFRKMNGQSLTWDATLTVPFSIALWYKPDPNQRNLDETLFVFQSSLGDSLVELRQNNNILEFKVNGFSDITIDWKQPIQSLEHIVCTVNSNNEVYFYKNGYLYSSTAMTSTSTPPIDISNILLGDPLYNSYIGDLQIFSKSLTQEEVFTNYLNYYRVLVKYDITTGIYSIEIPKYSGNGITQVDYRIGNSTVTLLSVPLDGTPVPLEGTITVDENSNSMVLLISMDNAERNRFHKNSDEFFEFILSTFNNNKITVTGSQNPYIEATYTSSDAYIEEGKTITVTLKNIPEEYSATSYTYELSGNNITEKDISGNYLSGTLTADVPISIIIREDYKTEDIETLSIAVDSLFLVTSVDIADSTVNPLTVNNAKPISGETFIVTLSWPPDPTSLPDTVEYEIDSIYVSPTGTGNFVKGTNGSASISFTVNSNAPYEEIVTLSLPNYDSTIEMILNDIPRLALHKLDEPNTTIINEGDQFVVTMIVPQTWTSPVDFSYGFDSRNSNVNFNASDINSTGDPTFDFGNMTGQFSFDLANDIREISYNFLVAENLNVEQDETIFVKLLNNEYSDICSNVLTIIDTAKPPSYTILVSVNGTENTNDLVEINEGDSFTVTLIPENSPIGSFDYQLIGINEIDLLDGAITGSFIIRDTDETASPDDLVKSFTVKNDLSIEGDEEFDFQIKINDTTTISKQFKITDTSVSPLYSMSDSVDTINKTITVQIVCTNHHLLTTLQRNIILNYSNTASTLNIQPRTNGSFQFGSDNTKQFEFTYDGTGDFVFEITNIDTINPINRTIISE